VEAALGFVGHSGGRGLGHGNPGEARCPVAFRTRSHVLNQPTLRLVLGLANIGSTTSPEQRFCYSTTSAPGTGDDL
jgi:hypothetical protein